MPAKNSVPNAGSSSLLSQVQEKLVQEGQEMLPRTVADLKGSAAPSIEATPGCGVPSVMASGLRSVPQGVVSGILGYLRGRR